MDKRKRGGGFAVKPEVKKEIQKRKVVRKVTEGCGFRGVNPRGNRRCANRFYGGRKSKFFSNSGGTKKDKRCGVDVLYANVMIAWWKRKRQRGPLGAKKAKRGGV